jgi:hypothetical protein
MGQMSRERWNALEFSGCDACISADVGHHPSLVALCEIGLGCDAEHPLECVGEKNRNEAGKKESNEF